MTKSKKAAFAVGVLLCGTLFTGKAGAQKHASIEGDNVQTHTTKRKWRSLESLRGSMENLQSLFRRSKSSPRSQEARPEISGPTNFEHRAHIPWMEIPERELIETIASKRARFEREEIVTRVMNRANKPFQRSNSVSSEPAATADSSDQESDFLQRSHSLPQLPMTPEQSARDLDKTSSTSSLQELDAALAELHNLSATLQTKVPSQSYANRMRTLSGGFDQNQRGAYYGSMRESMSRTY